MTVGETMQNGICFYDGPSELDGTRVLGIATNIVAPSTNAKTGPMVQLWFIAAEYHPWEAVNRGLDAAICGDCVHRGQVEIGVDGKSRNVNRSCYVLPSFAPANVWRSFHKGLYLHVTPTQARLALRGQKVRLAAYGDPSCVPGELLRTILERTEMVAGYTMNWRTRPDLARWCMASVSSLEERAEAEGLGFRTFRIRRYGELKATGEGVCPASAEMGRVTNCSRCGLCSGTSGKGSSDIVITVHGRGARYFNQTPALAA